MKIDIISGFLGAGKTTLIKKLLREALTSEKIVLVENEFGEIGIDGGFLRDAGVEIREMNSGCICCSLSGDFTRSIREVVKRFSPDRVIVEPSGVGKLSDVIGACEKAAQGNELELNISIAVADAVKYRIYSKNFAEFFGDQIAHAKTVVLSRTQKMTEEKLRDVVLDIQKRNPTANIITTHWGELSGDRIIEAAEQNAAQTLLATKELHEPKMHTHSCSCAHTHAPGEDCCGHPHAADDVFETWGIETPCTYKKERLEEILTHLARESEYGTVLRAKGILPAGNGEWLQFDYVPGEAEIRPGSADYTGRLCVIGSGLFPAHLQELFGV